MNFYPQIKFRPFYYFLFLLGFYHASAQNFTRLTSVMDSLKNGILNHAQTGISIRDVVTGKEIYDLNGNQSLIPASILKIATTAAALDLLGSEFRFKTIFQIRKINSGFAVIEIIGGGDPSFGSDRIPGSLGYDSIISKWVRLIKSKGIKIASINIKTDHFENAIPGGWAWNDISNYYGALAGGFNFNENSLTAIFNTTGRLSNPVFIPQLPEGFTVKSEVRYSSTVSKDESCFFGGPETHSLIIKGTIPSGKQHYKVKGIITDPAIFFAGLFKSELVKSGIMVDRVTTDSIVPADIKMVFSDTIFSPPLKTMVYYTNKYSLNIYAECFLKEIAVRKSGTGSVKNGIYAVKKYYAANGIDTLGVFIKDGSGLGRDNSVSPAFISSVLVFAKSRLFYPEFLASLPVAGKDGAMRNIGKGSILENNLKCKTGHMERVRSYAGYVTLKSGNDLAFSIILNNYEANDEEIKRALEVILTTIAKIN